MQHKLRSRTMSLSFNNRSKLATAFARVRAKHGENDARQLLIDAGVPDGLISQCTDENALEIIAALEKEYASDTPRAFASSRRDDDHEYTGEDLDPTNQPNEDGM